MKTLKITALSVALFTASALFVAETRVGAQVGTPNAATSVLQEALNLLIGAQNETAPATDTASSGLNGRLQRIAQNLTTLIGRLPSGLVGGRLDVNVGSIGGTSVGPSSCEDPTKVIMVPINVAAGTSTIAIAPLSGSTIITLCGYDIISSAAATLTLMEGAGSNCATSPTNKSVWNIVNAGDGVVRSNGGAAQDSTDAGEGYCIGRSASTALTGNVSIVQE